MVGAGTLNEFSLDLMHIFHYPHFYMTRGWYSRERLDARSLHAGAAGSCSAEQDLLKAVGLLYLLSVLLSDKIHIQEFKYICSIIDKTIILTR